MPLFTSSFAPPDAPANILATADLDLSRVLIEWDATSLGADFTAYRVYRSTDGIEYELKATITTEAASSYEDFEAPMDTPLFYRVTVSNVDGDESAPAEVTSELDEHAWYIVTPNLTAYTFRLRYVQGYSDVEHLQRTRHMPLGRRFPIIVTGELEAATGSIDLDVHPPDRWMVARLRELAVLDVPYSLLKTPFGEVYRVKIDPKERSRAGVAGIQRFALDFDEVA